MTTRQRLTETCVYWSWLAFSAVVYAASWVLGGPKVREEMRRESER